MMVWHTRLEVTLETSLVPPVLFRWSDSLVFVNSSTTPPTWMPFSHIQMELVQGATTVVLGQYPRDVWQSINGSLITLPPGTWSIRVSDPANPSVSSDSSVVVSGMFSSTLPVSVPPVDCHSSSSPCGRFLLQPASSSLRFPSCQQYRNLVVPWKPLRYYLLIASG